MLYRSPAARVLVNGSVSDVFPLGKGTHQGCSLSLLLFAFVLEPLAEVIRDQQGLSCVQLGDTEYRISRYPDDVLLYVTNPGLVQSRSLWPYTVCSTQEPEIRLLSSL